VSHRGWIDKGCHFAGRLRPNCERWSLLSLRACAAQSPKQNSEYYLAIDFSSHIYLYPYQL